MLKHTFTLNNIDCANCGAKMERKINELSQIENAVFTFATKKLTLNSNLSYEELIPLIQGACDSVEDGVIIGDKNFNDSHHHNHTCSCTHKHYHTEDKTVKLVFNMVGVDCANCGAKMEEKINELSQVENAVFTFATKKLTLNSNSSYEELIPLIQGACDSVEDGVTISKEENKKSTLKKNVKNSTKSEIITILSGTIIFITAILLKNILTLEINIPAIILFVISYLILGGKVLLKSGKNILKGQIFDENFLMSIATLGAFAIQEFPEAVGVMLFFRVGELFEKIAVEKSRSQIMETVDMRPETVNIVKDNSIISIAAIEAKVGDIVLVRPGDRIPLDGVVVDGESRIDTSAITGESVPIKVTEGSQVISGCVNTSNVIKISVEKPLEESMVTRILNSVENAAAGKPKIDNFITRFARVYTPIVVIIAIITAVGIPLVTGQDFIPWIYTSLSFLVMSCPCALVLSVPLAFFSGIGAGSKKGILFKGGISMETLSKVKAIVMDKTGTITKGTFEVQQINALDIEERELLEICSSCEQASTHPIATSIIEYSKSNGITPIHSDNIEEISGKGIKANINGKIVLCGNFKLMEEFGVDIKNHDENIIGTQVLIAIDGIYKGCIIISDTIKDDAVNSIKEIKRYNIFTAMLTGDEEKTAKSVAETIGIDKFFAKLLPQDKLTILQKIREKFGCVMFVGDGINDAPVLAGADVGAAMGSGADAAIEAADVVFMNSNTESISTAIKISKQTTKISHQNVIFALAIKICVMILGIAGIYSNMWLAVFADTGVAMLCILNSIRILFMNRKI